jgi:hypothetical protein
MKKGIIFLLVLIVSIFIGYNYIYKEHRNIAEEKAVFQFDSVELIDEFLVSQIESEKKYLDKVLSVKGIITELDAKNLTLGDNIFCIFENNVPTVKLGDSLIVKGRCIGFDELLEQVKLDQCHIIEL